jgi:hypothetical protein
MNRRNRYILSSFALIALILGLFGFFSESSMMKWIATAFGLALISVGLGISSYLNAVYIDRRINEMDAKLTRIENVQSEIQKEQREQASSNSPLVSSLQALSQYYFEYMTKQKGQDEKET